MLSAGALLHHCEPFGPFQIESTSCRPCRLLLGRRDPRAALRRVDVVAKLGGIVVCGVGRNMNDYGVPRCGRCSPLYAPFCPSTRGQIGPSKSVMRILNAGRVDRMHGRPQGIDGCKRTRLFTVCPPNGQHESGPLHFGGEPNGDPIRATRLHRGRKPLYAQRPVTAIKLATEVAFVTRRLSKPARVGKWGMFSVRSTAGNLAGIG